MATTFSNLPPEKQQRILNAAFREFAENGYDKASTNQIVKQASIGKGMLFHYFTNKQELYHFLASYTLDFIEEQYVSKVDVEETDFIERMKQHAQLKWNFFQVHPDLNAFLATIYLNEQERLTKEMTDRIDKMKAGIIDKLFSNLDYSLFRTEIDSQEAIQLIQWTFDGYQTHTIQKLKGESLTSINWDSYWENFDKHLTALKQAFYKEESK